MVIDKVREYLVQHFFRGEAVEAIAVDQPLITSGLLDSVATLKLVLYLEQEFAIAIDTQDIVDGALETLESIALLVTQKCHVSATLP